MTTPEVKRWREMVERFKTLRAAIGAMPSDHNLREQYFTALAEMEQNAETAIPAMARMIEEREAELKRLREALEEAETDLVVYQRNANTAAGYDHRWEGVAKAIQPTIDKARAALGRGP